MPARGKRTYNGCVVEAEALEAWRVWLNTALAVTEVLLAAVLVVLAWCVWYLARDVRQLALALLEQAELHRRTLEKITRSIK